jgi:transketolase
MRIPKFGEELSKENLELLDALVLSCRKSIIQMVANAQSGHPGGSLSCIDYLSLVYSFIITQTGEKIIISNGHISPAVYSILAELGYIEKNKVLLDFRKFNSIFEGHVTRHVDGVWFGTGPLGCGMSAATGFALAEKMQNTNKKVFALIGDGESQEGQIYEAMNFAAKYKLDNLIIFMDLNKVQLTDSTEKIMSIDFKKLFLSAGWNVIETSGHDFQKLWTAISSTKTDRPMIIIGKTIMGKGIAEMEKAGKKYESTWHGKAPTKEMAEQMLKSIAITKKQEKLITEFKKHIKWRPDKPCFPKPLSSIKIDAGLPIEYPANENTDCRTAYGRALADLAEKNKNMLALSADVSPSVQTNFVKKQKPGQHIECGIAEQQMVSCSGGLSLAGYVPFCSTFGAFMTSRAKDQARVNDINETNVKMVATHCGLSVGEDGPTHQSVDDAGSMLGLFNTMTIEPADPNQCDRIIRYAASKFGNFYIRMGRHKIPVITKENGRIFYDKKYKYNYGKTDVIRIGKDLTIVSIGSTTSEALKAHAYLKKYNISPEIIAATSIKKFDKNIINSAQKTKNIITVEDHCVQSCLGSQLLKYLNENNVKIEKFISLGIKKYELSGQWQELYKSAKIDADAIIKIALKILANKKRP